MPKVVSPEIREKRQRAAYSSREARRQQRDEAFTVKIMPAHRLSPAQLVAWRRLWQLILRPEGEDQAVPYDAA
jgi:hypothetical protein